MNFQVCWCVVALALLAAAPLAASERDSRLEIGDVELSSPVTPFQFEGDVRDLPRPRPWAPGDPIKEIPRRFYPPPGSEDPTVGGSTPTIDPLLGRQAGGGGMFSGSFITPTRNFPGQGFSGVNPPDTVGDVGPSHYIQMINGGGGALVQIYDKAEPTPGVVASFALDSLSTGGSCASGFGDPVVLWDRFAQRWMLSEFSSSGNNLCVYISKTPDPISGGWWAYAFSAPSFPDYPKYGVWPTDANAGSGSYVVTANDGGPGVFALDRGPMLVGDPATFQRLTIPGLSGFGFETPTPADLDGPNPPPALTPAIIMRHRDTENHSGSPNPTGDWLEMWHFDVDWNTPANTTLVQQPNIEVTEFDSDLCGLTSFFCFPQPGTGTTLDPLREVIMNRLQYIQHDDHESLVGNFVTDVDGTDHGGLRWFELRRTGGGGWVLQQEGTYAPDADHRFMAATAMDQSGNIAMAYNVTSSTTFPSLRYTGRLADDTTGTMTQPETSIHDGASPNSSNRYGDYSAMNLDPADDCTFWFTGMDNQTSSWRTQIASFAFDACGCELEPSALVATSAVTGDNEIEIGWNDADLSSVVEYSIGRSFTPGGPYTTIASVADTSPGIAGGAGYFFSDTDVSGGSTYHYIVRATDRVACTSDDSNEVSETATGACTLAPVFAGLLTAATPFSGLCTIDLSWAAATANCGGPIEYDVYRATSSGFTPGVGTLIAQGVNSTVYSDLNTLTSDVSYYYVVRARDLGNAGEEFNTVEVEAIPQGPLTTGTWVDDAGDSGTAKFVTDSPWQLNGAEGNLGPNVYKTGTYGNSECAGLTTPALLLGSGSQLSFSSQYDIEDSYDKGEVQISTDGVLWQRVPLAYPGASTNASDNCGLPTGDYFTDRDNLGYLAYDADLSAWNNQVVFLRFVLSTDGSVTETGWWIDDVSITQVDVPGTCTTGSSCEENPFVNVTPEGPSELCVGTQQMLSADLSGGTAPFSYQWTRDGTDIGGATSGTYPANDLGTHAYNCKVSADACPDEVFDGISTGITWRDNPDFDGLQSVVNPQLATCTLDLGWDPGASVCPGPITYSVYRDTTTPVAIVPGNLVASGVAGSSYSDSVGVMPDVVYNYVVRATETSTGIDDGNAVELANFATGPGGGPQTLLDEDFEDAGSFSGWTVSTGPGPHTCGDWSRVSLTEQQPGGSTGFYALTDSDDCGSSSTTSTILDSPVLDVTIPGTQTVTLEYDIFYNHYNGDDATVEVWDGSTWQVIWADTDVDLDTHQVHDVTVFAQGNPAFQVRFNYQNASYDWWFAVDNVSVVADVSNPCTTAAAGPPPVPDGALATTPLRGSRLTTIGDRIEVTWDAASCPSTDYDVIYGSLGDVASTTIAGAECAVGTSGTHVWTGVPPGNLFFLMVGNDGSSRESSWGTDSSLVERNGVGVSGLCTATTKDLTSTCP